MKEIKITSPEGYEIDREASTFDCIKFKPVENKNLTWEKIQEKNVGRIQYFVDTVGDIVAYKLDKVKSSATHAPTARIAEKIRALCQLYIIAEYYNEGWEPDWDDEDQAKHFMLWRNPSNGITTHFSLYTSGLFPVFKSSELLMSAYEANREIFETALKP